MNRIALGLLAALTLATALPAQEAASSGRPRLEWARENPGKARFLGNHPGARRAVRRNR